jgi:hypothetical protein
MLLSGVIYATFGNMSVTPMQSVLLAEKNRALSQFTSNLNPIKYVHIATSNGNSHLIVTHGSTGREILVSLK